MSQQVNASLASSRPALPISQFRVDGQIMDNVVFVEVTVTKGVNKHDTAEIAVLWPTTTSHEIERKTISFTYGTGNNSDTFYGYVYSTEKAQQFQKQTVTTIMCMGPTWHMRSTNPRMFVDRTADSIANTLVEPHRLGIRTTNNPFVFPRIAQVKYTDWEMLLEVAHLVGCHVVSANGVVRLVDPFAEMVKSLPKKRLSKSTSLIEPQESGLLDFIPVNSVTTNRKYLQPTMSYFASDSSVRTYVPDADPVDIASIPEVYVPDSITADHLIKVLTQWNQLNESADARVRGDGSIYPGDTVSVRTGTSDVIVDDYDGIWFVSGVTHKIDNKVFQTNLKLARDMYRKAGETSPYTQYWSFESNLRPSMTESNGSWISSWRQ